MQWEVVLIALLVLAIYALLGVYILILRDELSRWRRMALAGQGVQDALINVAEDAAARRQYLIDLRKRIVAHMTDEEIETLCYDLGADEIEADTRTTRARKLLEYLEQRGRVGELVQKLRAERAYMWQQADI